MSMLRVGQGWDIHRLVEGRPLRLGGVLVPFDRGLLGHSDGDAVVHAVCDALLGAAGQGDIGTHYPDTDPRYCDADSAELLRGVVELLSSHAFTIVNVDVTIIAEQPRLADHIPGMRVRMADLLRLSPDRVNLKAKTMEGLGTVGRGQAIATMAVALVEENSESRIQNSE